MPTITEINSACFCAPIAFTLPLIYHYRLIEKNKCHMALIIGTIILCLFLFTMIWVDKYILEE